MTPSTSCHDAVVVGLGAMGSAAARALASRGLRVLGLDRFEPPHSLGSSGGGTRMIREAYFEDPLYVPLVRRAYEAWRRLEARSGERLLRITGGLVVGPADGSLVSGARRSAREHDLACEELTPAEAARRFPAVRPPEDAAVLLEPRAGMLFPERCVRTLLRQARSAGADLLLEEEVVGWEPEGGDVRVETADGSHAAGRLLLAAGAWTANLLGPASPPLVVERQVQHWFASRAGPAATGPEVLPVYLWQVPGDRIWYGFPHHGPGVKAAWHHGGDETSPEGLRREVSPEEGERVGRLLDEYMPRAAGPVVRSEVCMYTNTPDEGFVVDVHPVHPQVVVAAGFSGHGFKFASALGPVLADLVVGETPEFDLTPFRIGRFADSEEAEE